MEDVASKIQTYQVLFWICLGMAVLCAAVAIALFFLLKIHEVFGFLTGRKAKRQILAMEVSNAGSGRLMSRERSNMHQMAQGIKEELGVIDVVSPGARVVEHAVKSEASQELEKEEQNTSLLNNGQFGNENTSLLGGGMNANAAAAANAQATQAQQAAPQAAAYEPTPQVQAAPQTPVYEQVPQAAAYEPATQVQQAAAYEPAATPSPAAYAAAPQASTLPYGSTDMLNNAPIKVGTFVIEKEIILVHAEDVI